MLLLLMILSISSFILVLVLPLYIVRSLPKKILSEVEERFKRGKAEEGEEDTLLRLTGLNERVAKIEERVKALEKEVAILKKRPLVPPKPVREIRARPKVQPSLARPPERAHKITSLSQLPIYYPVVKYACILTSQGFTVEAMGSGVDAPAKLLEIVKLSERFTGSKDVTIEKEKEALHIFYIDSVGDLDVYGAILAEKPINLSMLDLVKNSMKSYFEGKSSRE